MYLSRNGEEEGRGTTKKRWMDCVRDDRLTGGNGTEKHFAHKIRQELEQFNTHLTKYILIYQGFIK